MAIRLFITGGTFDKDYDEIHGRLYFKDTHVHEMLRLGRCRVEVAVRTLMLIDSLDMTDADRRLILESCRSGAEERIVITHGTDTLVETARVLGEAGLSKTIVLTGAMIPWAFGSSDGLFNLGSALSFAQALPHGVYVAMNGQWFPWDNVAKNTSLGVFERLRD
jgi:L-asparaginase